MSMSWTVRILLVVGGLIVGFIGLFMWADESEHGGWTAVEGYEEGYLVDGSVEIRQVPWSDRQNDVSGTYEVRLVAGDTYEVAFVDREGAALYTGTLADVTTWLDDQGEQVFVGTRAGATAWMDEQRATEKNFILPGIVVGLGLLIVIIGLVPAKRGSETSPRFATPHAPGM